MAVVQAGLLPDVPLAHTTVATILRRLERRGVVASRVMGRKCLFRSLVSEADVQAAMVRSLVDNLFEGQAAALIAHILREGDYSVEEQARLREWMRDVVADVSTNHAA